MLLQRVITALVLVPLVVAAVLQLSTLTLSFFLALVVLLGGFEWTRLAALGSLPEKLMFLTFLAAIIAGSAVTFHKYPQWVFPSALIFTLFWIVVSVRLLRYRRSVANASGRIWKSLLGVLVLAPAWISLLMVHGHRDGPYLVLYLMVLIWVADSCAYFAGRRWGRVKLAPEISPGKTREGVYGALAGAALCGAVFHALRPETGSLLMLILFSVVIALFSVVGDLFESLLKREAGLKDSGDLLPGLAGHRGYSIERIVAQLYLGGSGVFGTPLGVSATFVILIVLFGAVLEHTGASGTLMDIATGM
ncbi:MAG TPA: phosphatidate cytidylyltransferase, partial [Gammaproteobacteria bacterium]|nr:phosphatidate cytidylyltransferase [Gammaproteobacteria bacterium]